MNPQLLVPAAGMGARLGRGEPKALTDVAGKPMVVRALERFEMLGLADNAVVVIPSPFAEAFEKVLSAAFPAASFTLVAGGEERQASVWNGLQQLDSGTDLVVIHDAARPFVAAASVEASLDAAARYGAATVAIPSVDTILVADREHFLRETPDRSTVWACQTPQTFQVDVIRKAHEEAQRAGLVFTDDASLVRHAGGEVKLVMGTALNFKVTTPADLELAVHVVSRGLA